MTHHRASKQFDRGILFGKTEARYAARLRNFCEDSTEHGVRRLPHPAAEGQAAVLQKFEQLWDRIGTVLRVQQGVGKRRFIAKVRSTEPASFAGDVRVAMRQGLK